MSEKLKKERIEFYSDLTEEERSELLRTYPLDDLDAKIFGDQIREINS